MIRPGRLIWCYALSTAAALVLAAGVVSSQGHDLDGDSVPDGLERATQRVVVAVPAGDTLVIRSGLRSAPYEDEFEVSFSDGAFEVEYEGGPGTDIEYELELATLMEWVDDNGNGRLDEGEVVESVPLGAAEFANVMITHTSVEDPDGGKVHRLSIPSVSGIVTLNLTVAERFMRLSDDRILAPMEVKLDISIDRPFIEPGANLAIGFRLETDADLEYSDRSWADLNGFAVGDAAMNMMRGPPGNPALVFFSWAKTASADGRPIAVAWSSSSGSEDDYILQLLYLSGGAAIGGLIHDPTLGVRSEAFEGVVNRPPPLQADYLLYGGTFAGMVALVAATIVLANRRRRKRGGQGGNP